MAATVHSLFVLDHIAPGATVGFSWKNIPAGSAYAVDARPFFVGDSSGYTSTTEIEVTRFWRRTRIIDQPGSVGTVTEKHNDVVGQLKNVGAYVASAEVLLIVFT